MLYESLKIAQIEHADYVRRVERKRRRDEAAGRLDRVPSEAAHAATIGDFLQRLLHPRRETPGTVTRGGYTPAHNP